MNYPLRKIGDLEGEGAASIQTGPFGTQLKASDYTPDGVPVINVRNIGYGDLRADKLEYIPEAIAERLSVHVLSGQDIVFGRKGAVDRHLFVANAQSGWVQGSDCIRLRLNCSKINPRYVSYAFLSNRHKEWMLKQCSNKATMASLNQDVIRRIEIRLPKRPQQDQIVSILSAYDDLIENNRRRIALLEEAARMLYREWFGRFRFPGHEHVNIIDDLPEGWERVTLERLTIRIGSGATPRGGESSYKALGTSLIRSQNVHDYRFEPAGLAFIDDAQAQALANVEVQSEDILLNITGASVGRCCMAPRRFVPARVNQHVMLIRANRSQVSPQFLLYSINSPEQKERLLSIARAGGATREALTKDVVSSITCAIPPRAIREAFDSAIMPICAQQEQLAASSEKLAQARDLLLPRLMNGEIPV